MTESIALSRRSFLAASVAAATVPGLSGSGLQAAPTPKSKYKICAFIKFLQTLSYDELAEKIAALGFDGIEATIRDKGYILPEEVEEKLPKLVEALKKCGLDITVMASSINSLKQPHTEKVLRTAAGLGIKRYRLLGYRYDLKKPVVEQLEAIRPVLAELVAFHRQLGLQGVYQNHSGSVCVGAAVWDIYSLVKDYPVSDMGIAFDIRHATVEGGLAWPVHFNLVQPHLGAIYVKDFAWEGRKPENVPLGQGQVDPRFFKLLKRTDYNGPISLHVEYLKKEGIEPNVKALKDDLKTLKELLG